MTRDRVKELQEQIRKAEGEIDVIQKECLHKRILHKSGPDKIYIGNAAGSSTCLECGKILTCWTGQMLDKDDLQDKERIEVKE